MTVVTAKERANKLPILTSMRFLACFQVFIAHVSLETMFHNKWVDFLGFWLLGPSSYAVGFFFILSGFVLAWSAYPGDTTRRFIRRRMVRIWPNHFVTLTTGFILLVISTPHVNYLSLVPGIFLVHSFVPVVSVFQSTDGPNWSLCCDLLFYLSFPWVHRALDKIRPERLWAWACGFIAVIWTMPFIGGLLPTHPKLWGTPISLYQLWFVYMLPPVRMFDFMLGILVALMLVKGRWPRKLRIRTGFIWLTVFYILDLIPPAIPHSPLPQMIGVMAPFAVPLMMIVGAAAVSDLEQRPSRLRGRRMVMLGDLAFAFYLIHWMVVHYGHMATGVKMMPFYAAIPLIVAMFCVTLTCAWLLYTYVEQPMMRRFSKPRRPPVPPTPQQENATADLRTATEVSAEAPADETTSPAAMPELAPALEGKDNSDD